MRIAVIQFPGSNADWDALHAARDVLGAEAYYVFHKKTELGKPDALIIPGGFSYGDYLRCGAIARFSPITRAIRHRREYVCAERHRSRRGGQQAVFAGGIGLPTIT